MASVVPSSTSADADELDRSDLPARVLAIGASAHELPRLDLRADDEIVGYDQQRSALVSLAVEPLA